MQVLLVEVQQGEVASASVTPAVYEIPLITSPVDNVHGTKVLFKCVQTNANQIFLQAARLALNFQYHVHYPQTKALHFP